MSEKNSNRISLFIAIIAIILILGGVYMLNKSFSSTSSASVATLTKQQAKSTSASKTDTSKANKTTSSVASTDTSVTGSGVSSSGNPKASGSTTTNDTTVTKTETANSNNSSSNTPPPTANTSVADKKPEVQSTTKSPKVEPLAENEIIAKYLGLNSAGQARFEIQECGKTNSTLCTNPNKFSINNTSSYKVELTEGGNYKFVANYSEDASFILFNSIDSISPVN